MTLSLVGDVASADNLRRVHEFLVRDEAVNNLPIRLLAGVAGDPDARGRAYLAATERDGQVVAAAFCSWIKLVLARSSDLDAVRMIGRDARARLPGLPCVLGPAPDVEAFVSGWNPEAPPRAGMRQRIYCLTDIAPVPASPGHARTAGAADGPLVLRWFEDFASEVLHGLREPDMEAAVEARVRADQVLFWETDGRPVAMAVGRPATPHGAIVGPVFTPPGERGKGYATSLVAELSRRLLAGAFTSCFLYTDLSNSTSNSIYQRIGYVPVCDAVEAWFRDVPAGGWMPGTDLS